MKRKYCIFYERSRSREKQVWGKTGLGESEEKSDGRRAMDCRESEGKDGEQSRRSEEDQSWIVCVGL